MDLKAGQSGRGDSDGPLIRDGARDSWVSLGNYTSHAPGRLVAEETAKEARRRWSGGCRWPIAGACVFN